MTLPTPAPSRSKKPQKLVLTLVAAGTVLISIAVLSWLTGVRQAAVSGAASLFAPARIDDPAPRLTLTDVRGNTVSLADYRGRVVLVNNWATWCPPCQAEMPELQSYFSAHSGQGFVLVGIEAGDPAVQVADFVRQYALTFPVWLDPQSSALASFHNWSIPSSYVIDRDGTVRLAWAGPVDRPTLEKYLTPLLEK